MRDIVDATRCLTHNGGAAGAARRFPASGDPLLVDGQTRHRRTVRDYERLPAQHEAYHYWAKIMINDPPPRPSSHRRNATG